MSSASPVKVGPAPGPVLHVGQLVPVVMERITRAIGPKRATEVMRDTFAQMGDRPLDTPQDLLAFADFLIRGGGLVEAVGRSLKIQAILRGAVER